MAKIIPLSGDVGWEITANKVRTELAAAKGKAVEFHINSPGGFVSEGIEVFNVIRAYKGGKTAVITGVAASMGSYIPLACDKVLAYDNAIYMIHNPWTLAIGDYNDMSKAFEMLKGMANLLAKEYVKKTGSLTNKIQDFMDEETFFFGDEMKAEGFIDEIIDAPEDSANDNDKASALVVAKASITNCLDRMRDSEAANADMEKAVAYFDGMSALATPTKPTTPAATPAAADDITPADAGIEKQEDKYMTLAELLAANPAVQGEYDAAMAKARTEGATGAKDEMKATIAKVSPFLTSADYDADVKSAGIEAITGEGHIATFDTLVKIADRDNEKAKAAAAAAAKAEGGEGNGGEETPGQAAGQGADDATAYAEKWERNKGKGV